MEETNEYTKRSYDVIKFCKYTNIAGTEAVNFYLLFFALDA